jgi:hypothetical protein
MQTGRGGRRYTFEGDLNTRAHKAGVRDALASAERQEALGVTGSILSTVTTIAILCGMPEEAEPVVEMATATAAKPGGQQPRTLDDRCAALKAKMLGTQITSVNGVIKEVPLSAEEAAPYWGQSPEATRRYFREIPGVRIIPSPKRYDGGRLKRAYESLLIPPSILWREIQGTVKKSDRESAKESNRRINQAALTTRTPRRQR